MSSSNSAPLIGTGILAPAQVGDLLVQSSEVRAKMQASEVPRAVAAAGTRTACLRTQLLHVRRAGHRTTPEYGNAVGRERLRHAPAERVTCPNDLAAESSHRGDMVASVTPTIGTNGLRQWHTDPDS